MPRSVPSARKTSLEMKYVARLSLLFKPFLRPFVVHLFHFLLFVFFLVHFVFGFSRGTALSPSCVVPCCCCFLPAPSIAATTGHERHGAAQLQRHRKRLRPRPRRPVLSTSFPQVPALSPRPCFESYKPLDPRESARTTNPLLLDVCRRLLCPTQDHADDTHVYVPCRVLRKSARAGLLHRSAALHRKLHVM